MAVAALSTAALALTAAPAPTPPQGGESPIAFARLVTGAGPDGKAAQDGPSADAGAGSEADANVTAEDAAAPSEGEAIEKPAEKPVDLLAQIEAMVAAASQLTVSQPAPVVGATPIAIRTTPDAAVSAPPVFTMPLSTRFARQATIVSPAAPQPAIAGPAGPAFTEAAVPSAAPPAIIVDAGDAPVVADAPAGADRIAPKPIPSDISTMIASLKAAFEPAEGGARSAAAASLPVGDAIARAPAASMTPAEASGMIGAVPAAEALSTPAPANPASAPAMAERATTPIDPAIIRAIAAEMQAAPAKAGEPTITPAGKAGETAALPITDPIAAMPGDMASAGDSTAPAAEAPTDAAAALPDAPAATDMPDLPAMAPPVETLATAAPARPLDDAAAALDDTAAPSQAELSVERHLDLARDNQWLDRLARDISQAATQQGHLKFQLNPEHLGALTIEIANSAAGTAIRLTAETDEARQIIADAQPRLIAEVRAQGLRVAETHVDLNQQGGGSSAFAQSQQRQSSEDHKPFARTQTVIRDDAGDSADGEDGELYA